tara:strand:+ start:600 stop:710 length:111 start_codon:yes stop_codon:yes gene_type:complete
MELIGPLLMVGQMEKANLIKKSAELFVLWLWTRLGY